MVCPDCIKGEVLHGEPKSSITADFRGAYFSPGPGLDTSKRAVILLTDVFGLPLKNCKIVADEMARRLECDVWIPDYFNGKPIASLDAMMPLPDRAGVKLSLWDWIKLAWALIPMIPGLISNRPSVADRRVHSFIDLLKEKKKYDKLGAVGYCYGGSACVRLGGSGLVQSVVIAHPGGFSLDQVKSIKVPVAWVCAEEDFSFPDSLRLQSEAELAGRKGKDNFVEYEFKIYKGTAHGFASRPNLAIPEVKEAHKAALDQTVEWFKKTLA